MVLVPNDPKGNRDLFRRDQSDLDGTFSLPGIVPGSSTRSGDGTSGSDSSQPDVIAAYMKRGKKIEVGSNGTQTLKLPSPLKFNRSGVNTRKLHPCIIDTREPPCESTNAIHDGESRGPAIRAAAGMVKIRPTRCGQRLPNERRTGGEPRRPLRSPQ